MKQLTLFLFLLGSVVLAQAQPYYQRYTTIAQGGITFVGNTLGLNKASDLNAPGTDGSIGAFISLDTNSVGGSFPKGTTLNWTNNGSFAYLNTPTNSTILRADLIWGGDYSNSPSSSVAAYITNAITFFANGISNSVTPDNTYIQNGALNEYVSVANVTAIVQSQGNGQYAGARIPSDLLATQNSVNCAGWTLEVVYANTNSPMRSMSTYVANSLANGSDPAPAQVIGFYTPSSGVISARLFVSASEGDPQYVGDQMTFGGSTLQALSGPNNPVNNFFCSQINGDDGNLVTTGSFGLSNSIPGTAGYCARQGWDITSVDASAALVHNESQALAQNTTSQDVYAVVALGIQINIPAADLEVGITGTPSILTGQPANLSCSVTNAGPNDATNTIITLQVPTNSIILGGTSGYTYNTNTVRWAINDLPNNAITNFTIQYSTTNVGNLTVTAHASTSSTDLDTTNNTAVAVVNSTGYSILTFSKNAPATAHGAFDYTITVSNQGPLTAASPTITDTIPTEFLPLSINNGGTLNGDTVTWNLSPLAPHTSTIVSVTVLPVALGSTTNIATIDDGSIALSTNSSTPAVVTTVDQPPVAANYTASAPKGQTLPLNPLSLCTDADGDTLYLTSVVTTAGTISQLTANGFYFTPPNSNPQTNVINYTITDGFLYTNGSITILSTNRPPVANIFTNIGFVNQASVINPLTYDSDPDGDTITITSTDTSTDTSTANANISLANNTITVTPATNYEGIVSFNYSIQDTFGGQATGRANINFTPRPINANLETVSTPLNTQVTVYPLTGNTDINLGSLSFITASTTNGNLLINPASNSFSFTPSFNFKGTIPITYTIADQFGMVASNIVNVSVTSSPPVPSNFTNYTRRNLPLTISPLPYVTDADNIPVGLASALCFSGTANLIGTNIQFTPAQNYLGSVSIYYNVTNLVGDSAIGTITVTITNGTITAPIYSVTTARYVTNSINVLAGASDAEGDVLTLTGIASTNTKATFSSSTVQVTATNFPATDAVNYTLTDGFGGTNVGTIVIVVTNRPPTANAVTLFSSHNTLFTIPISSLGTDPENDQISIAGITATGTSSFDLTNVYYLPPTNFIGTNLIAFVIQDVFGATASNTITAIITNLPPVATNDSYTVFENGILTSSNSVLANDWDPQSNPMSALLVDATKLSNPTGLIFSTNGTFTYKPAAGYTGVDTFTYQAVDENIGYSESTNGTYGTVSISVSAAADIAVYLSESGTAYAGIPFYLYLTVTNLGPASSTNVVAVCTLPANMTIVAVQALTGSGSITSTNLPNIFSFDPQIPAGHADTYRFTVIANSAGSNSVQAYSQSATADPNPTNNNGTAIFSKIAIPVDASADIAVFSHGPISAYQETLTNITVLITNLGPSTATNIIVYNYTTPSTTNSLIVASLAPNTSTNVTFSVPVGDTLITNTTYASSAVFDPNLANNSSSNTNGQFTTTIIPDADLITVFTSLNQPGILVNGVITNEVTVINSGPATATNIQVKLAFAADLLYQTGAQGITNATAFWHINSLGVQASTNFLISFKATTNGIKSFVASCLASTADLQPANNNGTADASQGTVLVALPTFGSYIPTAKVNPQTGLYVETVLVTNLTQIPIPGFLAEVTKIPTGITLYNSQGTTNGYPFVTYNYPVTTGGVIPITLEFNNPKRIAFTNGLVIVPFMGSYPTNSSTTTNIIQVYYNYYTNNSYVLDFQTTPGHTYSVLYTPTYQGSNTQWKIAQPSTTATANYTIWIDSGPPNTDSKPSDSRYYELIEY